jgi:hypothetical protein
MKIDFSYVAIKPCGCMVSAIADHPEYAVMVSAETSRWMSKGWKVARVPASAIAQIRICHHKEKWSIGGQILRAIVKFLVWLRTEFKLYGRNKL